MEKNQESKIYRVSDVARILNTSNSKAYQIIKKLNDELKAKGMITVSGRISRKYFDEKVYMS